MTQKRILLVEDDSDLLDWMDLCLRGEGYEVDAVGTADAAEASLASHPYDLVIADWRLPDGDGTVVAAYAAETGAKTFVMSGYLFNMPGGRAEGHLTLMKPVRPSELVQAVRETIGGSGAP